ncbi:MAG: class I SAM-dependent methyltransferase [Bacteroidales bacterium]|nr:class I SAM-dependent methyltransferase [Bacteroidales bacterium]
MGKISKLTKALGLIARKPYLLNLVLNNDEVWKTYVMQHYGIGNGLPVVDLDVMFPGFSATVPVFAFLDGGSLPTDIALLIKLAEGFTDCSYFEIGTWRGESVVNVAGVAKDCFTLNLMDEEMRRIGQSEDYIGLTGFFSKGKKNIAHLKGNSKNYDFAGLNRKFDLIFIDGDHHYESVKNDTEKVFTHLIHKNSVVVWHDYARNPETVRHEVLAGILDGMPKEFHENLLHAANTLSAVYTNNKYPSHPLKNPTKPKYYFSINISKRSIGASTSND